MSLARFASAARHAALAPFLSALLAAPLLAAPQTAATPQVAPAVERRKWEHESSDLPVNARIHFGALKNGLRYAWLDNKEPAQRVYVRLHVDAGSLGESDAEAGMAHFLEHMAFNGSKNFPPGTLVEWLQKHGLGFGGDTNAMTDFSQTIYQLDLPTADEAMVADGLKVMRDVVDGLLLLDEEIGSEKGVIDGEERERESADFRAMRKSLETMFDGTLIPSRMPIGTKAARDAFDSKSMRAFYERWYRPDNCTLLIVGDLGGRDPVPAIETAFGDLAAPTTPRTPEPARGTPKLEKRAFAVYEKELPNVTLQVQLARPHVPEPDTRAERIEDLSLAIAHTMLNLRFGELVKKEGTPFLGAQVGEGGGLNVLDAEALYVVAAPPQWQAALAAAQIELRRALQHGFADEELEEVRVEWLRAFDEALKSESTRDSDEFVNELLAASEDRVVPTDAATDKALFEPALRALTVEQCQAALAEAWSKGTLVVGMVGGLDLGPDAEKKLVEAWTAGSKGDVAAGVEETSAAFAYGSDPKQVGAVATRAADAEYGFEEVVFANGVRLLVKKTDFKEREILVRALVGEGSLSLDPKESPLRLFAQQTFAAGGVGRHSADDLRRLTAGKQVGVGFQISEDAFVFSGGTTREDLLMQCELTCAYLTDPGLREEGATPFRRALPQIYESQKHQHGGVLATEFLPTLYGNDPRVAFPALEVEQAITTEQVGAWLKPAFAGAPITLAIAGDLDVDATIAAVAQTFGTLTPRRARLAWDERRVFPAMKAGLRTELTVDTNVAKALVVAQFATTDGADSATRRQLSFLVDVVNDRLRVEVREKLGASYSPRASGSSSVVYPGNGNLVMQALTEPDGAAKLADALLSVADTLARDGVTDAEVDRLRPEVLARLRDMQRMNGFWMDMLGGLHSARPVRNDLRTLIEHAEKLTAAPLTALAKKYLKKELASLAILRPKSGS